MNWFRIIFGTLIVSIVGIIVLIQWYKKIDSKLLGYTESMWEYVLFFRYFF